MADVNTNITEESENIRSLVNRYTLTVDINGFKYIGKEGTRIEYIELTDYDKNIYPVRVLTIHIPYVDVHAILHGEKTVSNGRTLYDINLLAQPLDNQAFQNKPFVDGKFKAILRDGDVDNDITESLSDDSRYVQKEQEEYEIPLTFYLYRQEELLYNQSTINLIVNNPSLSGLWMNGFHMANPKLKAVVSKFDHNPVGLGMMVIPSMDYKQFLSYLEMEFGLYKTDYMEFIEHGIYFLLNKSNNVNVKYKELEYKINVNVSRSLNPKDRTDEFINKINDQAYELNVGIKDVKFTIENKKSFGTSVTYIKPSGRSSLNNRGLSRNSDTVYKTTEIDHIEKLENTIYEKCTINIHNNSLAFITPLSQISINNSGGVRNNYRLYSKYLKLVSGQYTESNLTCFRLIEENS